MMFDWETAITRGLDTKLRQARRMAKTRNPDYITNHNDEVKDAVNDNFVKLDARIKKEFEKDLRLAKERRDKVGAGKR